MPDPNRQARANARPPVLVAAVALLAAVVYANSLRNGFALDDEPIIANNPVVHGLSNLRGLLLEPYWPGSLEMYRPLTLLTFAAGWEIHGGDAALLHLVNVLLHAAVAAVVVVLLLRLGAGRAAAGLGGAVFAVHPVHVEAVSNLIGRAEILATLFYLLACVVYARGQTPGRIAAVATLYLLGLLSKESAVTLPAALLLIDALAARHTSVPIGAILRRNVPVFIALAGTFALYTVVRTLGPGAMLGTTPAPFLVGLTEGERLALAARLWPEFMRLMFWPRELSVEWGPDVITVPGWDHPLVWAGVAILALLAYAAIACWRRYRWVSIAILWFGVTILPVSQIPFAVGVMLAERTLYLPSVALCFLAAPLVAAVRHRPRRVRAAAAGLALVLLSLASLRTWTRTPVWRSTSAVFDSMVEHHPEVWWVDWRAGQLLVAAGRWEEGIPWYERALRKTNGYHRDMVIEFSRILLAAGHPAEAERRLRHLLDGFDDTPSIHVVLSEALLDQGRFAESRDAARAAVAIPRSDPRWRFEAAHRLAIAYDAVEMLDSALVHRERSLGDPHVRSLPGPWYHLARLLALEGDTARARAALDSAHARVPATHVEHMRLDPLPPAHHPAFREWLGWSPRPAPGGPASPGDQYGPEGWLAPPE